jgi:hypothetical protein
VRSVLSAVLAPEPSACGSDSGADAVSSMGRFNHFEEEEVQPNDWAQSWLQWVLSRELPLSSLVRLWDTYLSCDEGLELHLYVCLAILTHCSDGATRTRRERQRDSHSVALSGMRRPEEGSAMVCRANVVGRCGAEEFAPDASGHGHGPGTGRLVSGLRIDAACAPHLG